MSRHGDSRDLGFVSHLGEKEGYESSTEDAKALRNLRFLFLDLVGNHGPDRHADERGPQHPAKHLRTYG